MFSRGQTTAANNEQEGALLSHILHVIGGVAALLKPEVLALFLDTNHEILTQLMTTPQTQSDAVSVVLLSLRSISKEREPDDLRSELNPTANQCVHRCIHLHLSTQGHGRSVSTRGVAFSLTAPALKGVGSVSPKPFTEPKPFSLTVTTS
jgi:hypothetical protein